MIKHMKPFSIMEQKQNERAVLAILGIFEKCLPSEEFKAAWESPLGYNILYTRYGEVGIQKKTHKILWTTIDSITWFEYVGKDGEEFWGECSHIPYLRLVFLYFGKEYRTRVYWKKHDVPMPSQLVRYLLVPVAVVGVGISSAVSTVVGATGAQVETSCGKKSGIGGGVRPVLGFFGFGNYDT